MSKTRIQSISKFRLMYSRDLNTMVAKYNRRFYNLSSLEEIEPNKSLIPAVDWFHELNYSPWIDKVDIEISSKTKLYLEVDEDKIRFYGFYPKWILKRLAHLIKTHSSLAISDSYKAVE